MRVFGRFLYALIAVGFFLLAFTYSRDLMLTRYLEDVFGASLTDEDSPYPDYYYFYTSIPDYHKTDPIISIDVNGYEIRGYEVLLATATEDQGLYVEEAVYLLVYSDTEDLSQVNDIVLSIDGTETTHTINLQRFKTLYILNGINDQGMVYLLKDLWLEADYNRLILTNHQDESLLETEFSLSETDFTIKPFIENFYDSEGRLPNLDDLSAMQDNNIFPNRVNVADDYVHIFYIAMAIYFAVLVLTTYLVFFRKRRRY